MGFSCLPPSRIPGGSKVGGLANLDKTRAEDNNARVLSFFRRNIQII